MLFEIGSGRSEPPDETELGSGMINPFGSHLLNVITYLPLVGALILLVGFRKEQKDLIARFATVIAGLDLLVSLPLWFGWGAAATDGFGFRFVQEADWIRAIGARYIVGVDGISMLLVLLTTVLGFIAILSSWTNIRHRVKEYYACMLLLQTGMLGVFISLDFFLFYIFWEVMLIPMYFIIGVWGGPRRIYAAVKFFIYTLLGSLLMLLGILALYFYHGSVTGLYTFDVRLLQAMGAWPGWLDLRSGSGWPSSSASRSRCRCSPSTPGCRTPTSRRRRPAR